MAFVVDGGHVRDIVITHRLPCDAVRQRLAASGIFHERVELTILRAILICQVYVRSAHLIANAESDAVCRFPVGIVGC